LLRILTYTTVGLCALYGGLYFLRGIPLADVVEMAAATVTSMIPQGLVLMATLAFTRGAVRMSARGALVQHLNAVESMAAVNVLCMDKTGTLTTNRLRLDQIRVLADDLSEEAVRDRLRLFASATVDQQNKNVQALQAAVGKTAVEPLDQLPFKSQNRYSAVRVRDGKAERIFVLGAFEVLRKHLRDLSARAESAWSELLPTGLRLLLFTEARRLAPFTARLDEFDLQPLALLALTDEIRASANGVLEELAAQGIGFKILSGDSPETVRATVAHLNLPLAREPVVSGDELAAAPNHAELIRTHSVFGRVSPRQKVEIVQILKDQGWQVAMIGDGVNDVLPIKRANLGIAMGEGSQASKTVAGLVLQTNEFGLLPETIEEGRMILRNLRRAGKLFLVKNVYTLFLIVGTLGVFRLKFPYLPQQVTLLNALTTGLPALIITLSRGQSKRVTRVGWLRDVGSFALATGTVMGFAGLTLLLISAWGHGDDVATQRTLLLSLLVTLGLINLLRVLHDGEARASASDARVRWLAAAAVPVYAGAMYLPLAAQFFELTPLSASQWALVAAVAIPAVALFKVTTLFSREPRASARKSIIESQPPAE